jgi:hypothetical protein
MQQTGLVGVLVALLKDSTGELQEAAAAAIESLMQHPACRRASEEHLPDLAAALVQVLVGGSSGGSDDGGSSTTPATREYAADAVGWLAKDLATRQVLKQQREDLVGSLVAMLRGSTSSSSSSSSSSTHGVQRAAATALGNLAADEGFAQRIVGEPEALPGLWALLKSSSTYSGDQLACQAAAGAMVALWQHASCRHASTQQVADLVAALGHVSEGGISSSSTPEAQMCAAWAVGYLADGSASLKVLGQQPGLVEALAALLSSSSSDVQGAGAWTLSRLAVDEGLAQRMMGKLEALLQALLHSSTWDMQQATACAMQSLMRHAACRLASIEHMAKLTTALVHVIRCSDPDGLAPQFAVGAIGWLAKDPDTRQLLGQQQGLVGAVVALLHRTSSIGNSDEPLKAPYVLSLLAADEGLAQRIVG